ncbi:MAG: hypothetical protein EPO68_04055 [Planctomycetota bacterium]|nr:MAG: hypothetical protein EPO68_04055 [Planctomycetota bacterium]
MSVSLRGSCALSFFVVALAWPTRAQSTVAERPRVGPDPTLVGRVDPAADAAIEAAIRDAAPWNGSCGLERVDGVLYGAGPRYKVEFGAHGFRYTTALGASSPIDGTLAFELESIRLGAQVLATGTASEPSQSGGIATYARGASIHEEYVVQADGVEQRFVFDSLPAGGGDLVVRGRIATPLVARDVDDTPGDGESPLGIRFEAPGYGSFVYGGVTGIDANGARAAGLVRFDGEHIELSLPESFVAHAALPLVLDPLLGSNVNVSGGLDLSRSDVAFDVTHNLYLVVWSVNFSSSNADVHGQRISPSGAKVGGLVLIEPYTNVSSGAPTVANNNGANRFLVAWPQTPSSLGGANDLVCRIVNASNGGISNVIQFAINGGELDSGGEMLEGYLNVQVVWQDSGIRGRAITVPATGDPGFGTTYVLAASTDALAPSISKSGGLPGRYLVAWRQKYGTYAWSQILGRTVHYDATLGPAAIDFTTHATAQKSDPAVDGDGVDFLVAYESVTIGGSTFDLKCKRVHWNGSFPAPDANETTIDPALHFAPHAAVSLLGGALLTGSATKYAVAWEDIDASAAQ